MVATDSLAQDDVAGSEPLTDTRKSASGNRKTFTLSYKERQEIWEWCREFFDREAIYRTDPTHPVIEARKKGDTYVWQVYSRRATLNQKFAQYLGLLFWDHFASIYEKQPFQVCACDPSGVPIGVAISNVAHRLGIPLNVFIARRYFKAMGTDNWFDGVALPGIPVLLVDDAAASAEFLKLASARVQVKLKLPLHRNYFAFVNKVGSKFNKSAQHTENYLDNELVSFFTMNNFCLNAREFEDKYGVKNGWTGLVK